MHQSITSHFHHSIATQMSIPPRSISSGANHVFQIRMLRLETGERMPFLLRDGIPEFWPMKWMITARRKNGYAARTLESDLFGIKIVYEWARDGCVDLEQRLFTGNYLSDAEIAAIIDACWRGQAKSRGKETKFPAQVSKETARIRAIRISKYVDWLTEQGIRDLTTSSQAYADWEAARAAMRESFALRTDYPRGKSAVQAREGLSKEDLEALKRVIHPDSPENPWRNAAVRHRNYAMIMTQLVFGMRRGELLGLQMGDVQIGKARLQIFRRADNLDDPRDDQPVPKTYDRVLELFNETAALIHDYSITYRRKTPNAKRHPFVWVSHRLGKNVGRPLSLASYSAVFKTLRERVPSLPRSLTSHVLRHTWNDAFSHKCDEGKKTPEWENHKRSYHMGWSQTGMMAATYTRRHIRESADEFSLKIQEDLLATQVKPLNKDKKESVGK